ncbi:golgin subfamily A member 2-like isoform X2 [Ostrea edulis]|uniref:golgin subfamily A member 2-like isoform X2 n=1 Tax=Ostrea edulis TaxID=37623 RepID=UPI0024AF1E8C|nr:golgin subfamily A member 2-like isoform X2 [Ostrea edulis]
MDGKKEKIAAARKKLKKFKQSSGGNLTKSSVSQNKDSKKQKIPEVSENSTPEESVQPNEVKEQQNSHSFPTEPEMRTTGSTESLHQLSRQLNGLISEPQPMEEDTSGTNYMETRNKELANQLQNQREENHKLHKQVQQAQEHAQSLQSQLDQEMESSTEKQKKEMGPLREQLQVHIQTIGILVAEKTELQSQLSQSQKIATQRLSEIEDISSRLKISRQRTGDLERSLATATNSAQQFEISSKEFAREVDRLKIDLHHSRKSQEDLHQVVEELGGELQSKKLESSQLEESVRDLKSKVEMAELYVQQSSSQGNHQDQTLQSLEQQRREMEALKADISEIQELYSRSTSEKEENKRHYQSVVDQLQHHNSQLTSQVTTLTEEREKLVQREHDLEVAVLELQEKLQNMDSDQTSQLNESERQSQEKINQLMSEQADLKQQCKAQSQDNANFSSLLEEKEERISDLEGSLSQLKKEAEDTYQLLEGVQNDKTALSRALAQNKDLKQQLVELQNGFVKMSNDNMELMTKVQSEQHSSRELLCRLSQQDEEIKQLKETISNRENLVKETQNVENTYIDDHLQDRLRHYEAQAQLVETLQRELHNSQDMIDALTTQNSELRTMLIKSSEKVGNNGLSPMEVDTEKDELIASLQKTVRNLEVDREQLIQNLNDQRQLSDKLSVNVADMQEELIKQSNGTTVSSLQFTKLENTMELIQEKYNRVMKDKADLCDRNDELEHIVLQLQGESDTIGEYISLYHHQRALLQQRETQKNEYISHLARDREEIQGKLSELQILVMQLLGEKNMLHHYHEQSLTGSSLRQLEEQQFQQYPTNGHQPGMTNGHTDWPDYTSSESDADSEVEVVVETDHNESAAKSRLQPSIPEPEAFYQPAEEQPVKDNQTASKILHLLSEIGHSNLIDHTVEDHIDHNFLPCKYCKGQVLIV